MSPGLSLARVGTVVCLAALASPAIAQFSQASKSEPPIYLEVLIEMGAPLTSAQKWIVLLNGCGFREVRIRSSRPGEKMAIKKSGTDSRPNYRVVGYLNSRGELELPAGKFRYGNKSGIRAWVKKVQADGSEELFVKRGLFGLTDKELIATHEKLAPVVALSTKNIRCGDVARTLVRQIKMPYTVAPQAVTAFRSGELVLEEMRGMSCGTALAAAIRPLGLVVTPRKPQGKPVELYITPSGTVKKSWPIGWPLEAPPVKVAPKLFEYLTVTITSTKTSKTLDSIQAKAAIPFLYDRNSILANRIDLEKSVTNIKSQRLFIMKLINEVAFQAKLKTELRTDEAGRPFLWITTLRRAD